MCVEDECIAMRKYFEACVEEVESVFQLDVPTSGLTSQWSSQVPLVSDLISDPNFDAEFEVLDLNFSKVRLYVLWRVSYFVKLFGDIGGARIFSDLTPLCLRVGVIDL